MTPEQDDAQTPNATALAKVPPWWRRVGYGRRVAIGVVAYVVVAVPIVLYAPAELLNNWVPGLNPEEQGKLLGAAGNLVLLALGGVIAVVTVGLSLSRHRQELHAAARDLQRLSDDQRRERARLAEVNEQRATETERALRQRFVTTVQLLSEPAPVNRQAALYALGSLADDWHAIGKPDEVQVCIEVLTGYLRAPRSKDMLLPLDAEEAHGLEPEDHYDAQRTTPQEVSVKQAGYYVIRNHLQQGVSPSWHDRSMNLAGAHIDFPVELLGTNIGNGGVIDLRGARIGRGGKVDLGAAQIMNGGRVYLTGAVITEDAMVDLRATVITGDGRVDLSDARISRAHVNLARTKIADSGNVVFRRAFIARHGSVNFRGTAISNGGSVDLLGASITDDGEVILTKVIISDDGYVDLSEAAISSGANVDFTGASITDDGRVNLEGAAIGASGRIDLTGATISDSASVDLDAPKITDGGRLIRPNEVVSKKNVVR
ncbi:hypothetical protein MT355_20485 [Rathayibacter sp. VKM Ac-2929]|uniref:hypothetical protein n=1 Tax=Rathayibacter sp. VKM Ac-2929 TaxID=2929480 RepID=UPI001FB515FE|nr:hypothetical protein [Rathayibacter sp. VKM Ac-2929]MCJ1675651.1 hypothetical protein [Rathayibacter sp. VKM Ac-2929]